MTRRKLTEEQVAALFVETTFETVEQGWPEIAAFLNASPVFIQRPNLDEEDYGRFLMIIVSANLQLIPKHFDSGIDRQIIQHICSKYTPWRRHALDHVVAEAPQHVRAPVRERR